MSRRVHKSFTIRKSGMANAKTLKPKDFTRVVGSMKAQHLSRLLVGEQYEHSDAIINRIG